MTASYEDGSTGNKGPNRLKRIKAVKGATTISDFSYGYTKGTTDTGLRQSVTDNGAGGTYGYDVLNRLISATNIDGHNYTYSYGANGNILEKTRDGVTTSYGYNLANEICWSVSGTQPDYQCSPTPTGATTYTYDTAGNMIGSSSGLTASYNAKNQVTSSTGLLGEAAITMGYFGTNQFERGTAGSKSFVNNALGVGSETTGTSSTYYRRDNSGGLHSERLPSGAIYYYVFDGLGSVTALTDSPGGTAQDTYGYEPYGTTTISGTVPNPWQFASGYHDTTNWYKFGMRYYAARLGRWSQLDPKEQPTDPVQANRYSYAADDPANHADPTGEQTPGGYYPGQASGYPCPAHRVPGAYYGAECSPVGTGLTFTAPISKEHFLGGVAIVGGSAIVVGCAAATEGIAAAHCAEAAAPLFGVGALALGQ
jgi:RHS repeat-associated protein